MLNSFRYADRLKERPSVPIKPMKYASEQPSENNYENLKSEPDLKAAVKLENINVQKSSKNRIEPIEMRKENLDRNIEKNLRSEPNLETNQKPVYYLISFIFDIN